MPPESCGQFSELRDVLRKKAAPKRSGPKVLRHDHDWPCCISTRAALQLSFLVRSLKRGSPMSIHRGYRRRMPPPPSEQSIYRRGENVGVVSQRGRRWLAIDEDGRRIGFSKLIWPSPQSCARTLSHERPRRNPTAIGSLPVSS
jgi:hypothetical protein